MIAEQSLLAKKKTTRQAMGRDKFVEYVESTVENSSGKITSQMKRLGASVNWNMFTYTMDKRYCRAVSEAVRLLFNQRLIVRKPDNIRWSPTLQSSTSDSEVDMRKIGPGRNTFTEMGAKIESDNFGLMFFIKYDVIDGDESETRSVTVATTRPETMLADVALVVNPNDPRYSDLIGKRAVNPVNNQSLPILADRQVTQTYGTGVMKLTPAHNVFDKLMGERLGFSASDLKQTGMWDEHCRVNLSGQFTGMNRFEARDAIVEYLKQSERLTEVVPHESLLPFCARSGDLLEFLVAEQWFVDTKSLYYKWKGKLDSVGERSSSDLLQKNIEIIKRFQNQDWCISRQIWWGHPIPAYRVFLTGQKQGKGQAQSLRFLN